MTPAIDLLIKQKLPHQVLKFQHEPGHGSFALEAAEKLHLSPAQVFKTLVVETDDGRLAVGIVPADKMLNLKRLAKALRCKKATMAPPQKVERSTGYIMGGVSPFGQKKPLPTVLDSSANAFDTILVSGGKRGLELEVSPSLFEILLNASCYPISSE